MGLIEDLARLQLEHRTALQWFQQNAGRVLPWPQPLGDFFLVNKAKGIHKPRQLPYALSVRESQNSPYADRVERRADGAWKWDYPQEGADADYFTNSALRACMQDGVPVGVIKQVKGKPNPQYEVFGLGRVIEHKEKVFVIHSISPAWEIDGNAASPSTQGPTITGPTDRPADLETQFDPTSIEDARERQLRAIALRRGQAIFRRDLLAAYGGRCAICGCNVEAALEAAHIVPYLGPETNRISNGLPLRADLHTLFDLYLLWVDPKTRLVQLHPTLKGTEYEKYSGMPLRSPLQQSNAPSAAALEYRLRRSER